MWKKTALGLLALWAAVCVSAQTPKKDDPREKRAVAKAEEHLKFEEYRSAIEQLKTAHSINPDNLFTNYWLGVCYFKVGLKTKATEHFETVVRLNPDYNKELAGYYAQTLHHNLKLEEALKYYYKQLGLLKKSDPNFAKFDRLITQCKNARELIKRSVPVEITNVGPNVNSKYPEYAPVISADETVMMFTTRRPDNLGGAAPDNLPYEDVYITRRQDTTWSLAKNMLAPINTPFHDASVALSADGQTFFVYRDENRDVLESRLKGSSWSQPERLPKPIQSSHWEPSVCLSGDENVMFFVSDRPGGYGGRDIYYTLKNKKGKWGPAVNCGPTINTLLDEDGPFFHSDGQTLYFSSEGHYSMGGYDIFKTIWSPHRKDAQFTPPKNIGYPINTPDDDVFFVISASGQHGYYASAKEGGFGEKDIYMINFNPPLQALKSKEIAVDLPDSLKLVLPDMSEATVSKVTMIKGVVLDEKTKKPIEAEIYIVDNERNDTLSVLKSNSISGNYLVTLPSGKNYGFGVQAKGYLFHSENFDIPDSLGFKQFIKEITLKPFGFAVGSKIILRNIFYDFSKATLRDASRAELERLHKILIDHPELRIRILGHTDNVGSDEYNRKLSDERAKSVVDYLVKRGIAADRLEWKGLGETAPIDSNETPDGRQANRRTEFEILQINK